MLQCFRCKAQVITKGTIVVLAERPPGWVEIEAYTFGVKGGKRVHCCPECWKSLATIDMLVGALSA